MSVDQLPPGKARPASREPQIVRYGEYVDQQIESTRKLVKFVDAMTIFLVIAAGTILFLLTAAVVEHWLVPSGYNFAVRSLLFLLLVGSVGYFAVRRLWPLCVSAINPAYAAQAIEHDNPALKNSLLNLLLFRQHREQVTDAVYETLEEQAAKRLTRVPVESAVDRTQLLRLAYVLMVIVAIAAMYKIFSPKDPFVTVERVLLPWANVVPASRVSIENVEPGHVTLARGEVLNVSADVRGIGDDDPVIVKFTTADGQAVDRPAAMTPSATGLRFTGQIPPADDASRTGVAQNLRYRIEAGDARSLDYSVTVIAAPTITVDRIDYDYPDYTGLADRSIERQGDIRALEGTRVTIYARANQQIKEASLDFEADGRRDATLQIDGTDARTGFELALRDDRQTAKFTSYVLRFTDVEGRSNRNPVKYPIEVEPDVAPEATVVAPKEKSRDVQLDETITIEVDAIDPNFGLAEVRVHGEAAGRTVIDEKLLSKRHTGRFTGRVRFTPIDHSLKPGDVVRYWVTARDDRPNETASDSQTLRITSPDPNQPRPDRLAQRDEPKPQDENSQQDSDQQGEAGESGESGGAGAADSSQGKQGDQLGEPASAGGQNGQPSEQNQNNQPGDQQSENQSNQPGEQGNSQSSDGQSGSNESDGNQSGEQQGADGQSGGNQSGSSEQHGEQQGNQSGDSQQQPGNNSGNSGLQNDSQQPSTGEPSGNESGRSSANNSQPGSNRQNNGEQPGESDAPVSPEGDNDGEAFERIQNFLERDGKLPDQNETNEQQSKDSQQDSRGESTSADGQSSANSEERSPSPSDSNSESNSEQGNDPADGPGADNHPGDNPEQSKDPSDGKQAEDSQSPSGQQTSSKGESGAGNESRQNQGSPDSQPATKPTDKPSDKWEQKPSGDKPGEQDPSSGGRGKQESDSQGNEGGDHTGGGEEGGGQKANRDGTGSSGQNQSADDGAGESSEQGQGNTSSNAGDDAQSKSPTGESSEHQSGAGSSQRDGTGNQQGEESPNDSNSAPGESASAGGKEDASNQPTQSNQSGKSQQNQQHRENTDQSNSKDQPNEQQGTGDQSTAARGGEDAPARSEDSRSSQNPGGDAMSGAGRPPQGVIPPSKTDGTAPAADDANLEYARKRTDLVLETLAEQMKRRQVDKRLLDELGWTEADMKRFLDRWQQLKAAAQNDATADDAKRELDDALRSLGLRRGALQQSRVSDDTDRDLRQGFRGPVPQEYQDRLKAYNQGVSRARQQEE